MENKVIVSMPFHHIVLIVISDFLSEVLFVKWWIRFRKIIDNYKTRMIVCRVIEVINSENDWHMKIPI